MAFQEPSPWLFSLASFDLNYKEGLDMTLKNLSLLEEATNKTEDKIKDRVLMFRQKI